MLGDSGLSINPDLIFGDGLAIGDVKYKQLQSVWNKPDFNQIVTFATGFQSKYAILLGFASSETAVLSKPVQIGDVSTMALGWLTADAASPESSRNQLVAEVKYWLLNNASQSNNLPHKLRDAN